MLISIITLTLLSLLFGGPGDAPLNERILDQVEDELRAQQAVKIAEEAEKETLELNESLNEYLERLWELDSRHETSAVEYHALYREIEEAWLKKQRKMLDLRFELRKHIEREEWNALFKVPEEQ